ncbi:MAG TPA: acyl-CoA thioester hydrolase/BAAT C-terminal domain-containing protein [Trebonia sp.]|jgi:dienelactone hydrolase|nr:acyl-CoA thioester hydrolase/BAAT C-terminal domain-containing protein [Trebonia sp.]
MSMLPTFRTLLSTTLIGAGLACMPAITALPAAAAVASGAASGTAAPGSTASRTTAGPAVEVCGYGSAVQRPDSMILTCADGGEVGERLHWTTWTSSGATATGVVAWRSGPDALADSTGWSTVTADFTLDSPAPVGGQQPLFTNLDVRVTGSTPNDFLREQAFDEAPLPQAVPTPRPEAEAPAAAPANARAAVPAESRGAISRRPAVSAAASGTLGYADIEGYWDLAGGPSSQARTAAAITGAESSFVPGIIQQGVDYCGSGSDRAGWGLWQITCGNAVPAYGKDFQLLDPWNNAEAAVRLYDSDAAAGYDGFSPWVVYSDGAYEKYLENAAADTKLSDRGEYEQDGSTPPGTPASPPADPGGTYGPGIPAPAPPPTVKQSYQVSFQANSHDLASFDSAKTQVTSSMGMDAGTNPASAELSNGTFMAAIDSSGGDLYFYKWSAKTKLATTHRMDTGTSPALAALPTGAGWVAAYQANTHYLYIDKSNGSLKDTGLLVEAGTSPAIAVQPDGAWAVAYTSDNGLMATYNSAGDIMQTTDAMNTATSPAIAAIAGGSYEVAFEAKDNDLSLYRTGGATDNTSRSMAARTSPAIASHDSSGWEVAWQANNDKLGTADSAGQSVPVADALSPGSRVSAAPYGASSYEIAFTASDGDLGLYRTGGSPTNTTYKMDAGTSPSLAIPAALPAGDAGPRSSWRLTGVTSVADFTTRVLRPPSAPVHGTLFVPAAARAAAAVLLIGGSGGSEPNYVGQALAREGIAALSVAYFARPGLPGLLRRIRLEYFFSALEILRDELPSPAVPIVVLGMSRGSEAAMLTAIHAPVPVRAMVATVPGNVVAGSFPSGGPAWLLGGRPLPYAGHADPEREDADALIPAELIPGPVLLVAAGADQVWPSASMARALSRRLREHGDPHGHTILEYPAAGHSLGYLIPDLPTGLLPPDITDPAADRAARADAWPRAVAFIRQLRTAR